MGSVKFKDLKAYVRYDGSGRVVAGSLVFRKKKPKNGRWGEISSNLCCNPGPNNSTTTTTTQGGGGTTPTAFVEYYYINEFNACNAGVSGSLVFYSAATQIAAGNSIFQDAALTIPVTEGLVILTFTGVETRYLVGAGGVLSLYTCPVVSYETFISWSYMDRAEACSLPPTTVVYSSNPNPGAYTALYTDAGLTNPINYAYVAFNNSSYAVISGTGTLDTRQDCTSQEQAIGAFSLEDACAGNGTYLSVFYAGTIGNGTALYTDAALTQPYDPGATPVGNGTYLRIYFEATYQVCTMSGNIIQSYAAC